MADANVVDLDARRKRAEAYDKRLRELVDLIADFRSDLEGAAFNLALAGPWREWDESVPAGTVITLSWQALGDTGDANLDAVARIERVVALALAQLVR
ncbi:MAG: hypothetical protein EP329_01790 [Deltaproteobacteria bacterium]|nr:MAG: hypothetical protein EP329_01790 [Deltaproteobacteria bacterium]